MEKNKSIITSVVVLVVVIIFGVWIYSQKPLSKTEQVATPDKVTDYTYPNYYPQELAFDFSRIEKISESKDENGKNMVVVEYTSINPIKSFVIMARQILEMKKWTITEGGTGDKPSVIVATRGTETVTVNLTENSKSTLVKVYYQQ